MTQAPFRTSQIEQAQVGERSFAVIWILLLCQTGSLLIQVLAVCMGRLNVGEAAVVVSSIASGLTYASALWALTRPQLARVVRNTAVICLGVTTALQLRMNDPCCLRRSTSNSTCAR